MPNKYFAHYEEWKIWFEKHVPYLSDDLVLIGHSMGGIFLAKYLSENNFPRRIKATFLVAAPFDDEDAEDTVGDFALSGSLANFKKQAGKIFLYQSKDDTVVPYADLLKYKKELPGVVERVFEDRGHFTQEELPEIVEDIRSLS
jgi:predicted alpha/beta hydrolase family esterase